jgi:RimJ/RimL family protein N-acetyltransferase
MNNCEELTTEYNRMYGIIKANGHALASDAWTLDAGILLKTDQEIIAGSFFNLSKSPSSILIHIIFVEDQHRQQGIYTKMHSLIDTLGKELSRSSIYSYIHSKNQVMQEHIMKKIGYEPVMQLVKKEIK